MQEIGLPQRENTIPQKYHYTFLSTEGATSPCGLPWGITEKPLSRMLWGFGFHFQSFLLTTKQMNITPLPTVTVLITKD